MKLLKSTYFICAATLALCACDDTSSGSTGTEAENTADNSTSESISDSTSEAGVSTPVSTSTTPTVTREDSEQYVSEPVDVSEISDDPIIKFENGSVTVENDNGCITLKEKVISLYCGGNYQLIGSSSDNQVIVNAGDSDKVYLYLNELQLASATDAPIYIQNAEKTFLMLVDGTKNSLEDAASRTQSYTKANGTSDTTNATLYAKDDLTI
ncbi:MAG: carbohydrate-binding domain-containing protein, partial [Paludibacteraceae bacterium]|nr:carbohydrate-binding domain-containing protein [Paludibacteraceae bacterium]